MERDCQPSESGVETLNASERSGLIADTDDIWDFRSHPDTQPKRITPVVFLFGIWIFSLLIQMSWKKNAYVGITALSSWTNANSCLLLD